jgi:hypothetical protein
MADDDDFALVARQLQTLSTPRLQDFVATVRAQLPYAVRTSLPPNTLPARKQLDADLEALRRLDPADAERSRALWMEAARAELGAGDVDRLRAQRDLPVGRNRELGRGFVPEKLKIDLRDDMVPASWLAGGAAAAAAVAYLEVPKFYGGAPADAAGGTGFLVDRQHLLTAFHVVEARDEDKEAPAAASDLALQVRGTTAAFDYVAPPAAGGPNGTPQLVAEMVAHDRTLDYALLRLAAPVTAAPLTLWAGALPVVDRDLAFAVNIIQHPERSPKRLALRNNAVWKVDAKSIFYFTDTLGGSSGAPVFNDAWKVLAVHTGFDWFDNASYMGRRLGFSNRGTRVTEILSHLAVQGVRLEMVVER